MADLQSLKTQLGLPPISQIGVVVRNVDEAARHYSSLLGIGPFTIYEFRPESDLYNGERMEGTILKMGKAAWNGIEMELIEPVKGRSPHMDWLRTRAKACNTSASTWPTSTAYAHDSARTASAPSCRALHT